MGINMSVYDVKRVWIDKKNRYVVLLWTTRVKCMAPHMIGAVATETGAATVAVSPLRWATEAETEGVGAVDNETDALVWAGPASGLAPAATAPTAGDALADEVSAPPPPPPPAIVVYLRRNSLNFLPMSLSSRSTANAAPRRGTRALQRAVSMGAREEPDCTSKVSGSSSCSECVSGSGVEAGDDDGEGEGEEEDEEEVGEVAIEEHVGQFEG